MIEILKIKLDENGYYILDKGSSTNPTEMKELGIFLVSDIGCGPLFKRWFVKAENTEGETNLYFVKKDDHEVYISSLFGKKDNSICRFSKKEFLHILDEWGRVCEERPKEVIITYENGKYKFETKN